MDEGLAHARAEASLAQRLRAGGNLVDGERAVAFGDFATDDDLFAGLEPGVGDQFAVSGVSGDAVVEPAGQAACAEEGGGGEALGKADETDGRVAGDREDGVTDASAGGSGIGLRKRRSGHGALLPGDDANDR